MELYVYFKNIKKTFLLQFCNKHFFITTGHKFAGIKFHEFRISSKNAKLKTSKNFGQA
jgi:hypothetical protein